MCDNTSPLNMAKNPMQHKMTKHIDVRQHFLRDNMEKVAICMKIFKIEDQVDDIFIKVFHSKQFVKNRLRLGLNRIN